MEELNKKKMTVEQEKEMIEAKLREVREYRYRYCTNWVVIIRYG
jgi:flagellar biosynthesis chaperone FliJ